MNKRLSIIDLWKFIAAILIMVHHFYHLGEPFVGNYFGRFTWIYVEFFFMLTGYFTYQHFTKTTKEDIFKAGLKYTAQKFKPFVPYVAVAVTLQYIFSAPFSQLFAGGGYKAFFAHFLKYPFEVLLLAETQCSINGQSMDPLWFLSAMLLTFPIVTTLCQIKNKYLVLIVSGLYSLFYYGRCTLGSFVWPNELFRALAGMLTGVVIYIVIEILKESNFINNNKKTVLFLTIVELLCMSSCLISTLFNLYPLEKLIILTFAIAVGCMLCGYSLTAKLNNNFISYLGKLSMPIYIWHWLIATVIARVNQIYKLSTSLNLFIYFAGTIIVSVVSYSLLNKKQKV